MGNGPLSSRGRETNRIQTNMQDMGNGPLSDKKPAGQSRGGETDRIQTSRQDMGNGPPSDKKPAGQNRKRIAFRQAGETWETAQRKVTMSGAGM